MRRAFVDTSAWYAYANRADPAHARVVAIIDQFAGRLVTSNFVFDETVTLTRRRAGFEAARRLGEAMRRETALDLVRVDPETEDRAWRLFVERPDQPYSFTDCTSFELMRALGLTEAIALDADFSREGFTLLT